MLAKVRVQQVTMVAQGPAETRLLKEQVQSEGRGPGSPFLSLRIRDKRPRDGCSGFHTQ